MPDDMKAESAEDIIRRWANWIIDVSADMEGEDHAAGKRKVRAERDLILSERRKMVEALEKIASGYGACDGFQDAQNIAAAALTGSREQEADNAR